MLCGRTVDQVIEAEQRALGSLSEEEQEAFMNIFDKYTEQLKKNMRVIPGKGGSIR